MARPLLDDFSMITASGLLPDFLLAACFFSALAFAVLGKRLGHRRAAAVMSATLGLAMGLGLVAWEWRTGWRVVDLGTIAVGFALIVLSLVLYQAMKQVGGTVAGAATAIGAALTIGLVLDLPVLRRSDLLPGVVLVAAIVAMAGLLLHHRQNTASWTAPSFRFTPTGAGEPMLASVKPWKERRNDERVDVRDLREARTASDAMRHELDAALHLQPLVDDRPEAWEAARMHLQRALPAAGWLTQKLAEFRETLKLVERGELEQIHEVQKLAKDLPPRDRRQLVVDVRRRLRVLRMAQRLDRLDGAVAELERRVQTLTRQAISDLDARNAEAIPGRLDAANRLQRQVARLLEQMERSRQRLLREAEAVIRRHGVTGR